MEDPACRKIMLKGYVERQKATPNGSDQVLTKLQYVTSWEWERVAQEHLQFDWVLHHLLCKRAVQHVSNQITANAFHFSSKVSGNGIARPPVFHLSPSKKSAINWAVCTLEICD